MVLKKEYHIIMYRRLSMKYIILKVTIEEGDKIITGLAELPYKISYDLINKIQLQAQEQLNQKDDRKYDDIANKKLSEAEK